MRRKASAKPDAAEPVPRPMVPAGTPVNVVVVVETKRRPRSRKGKKDDGHPLLKTAVGLAIAKRLTQRRKRPLRKRLKRAVRHGRRKVRRSVRRVRRALR